MAVLLEKETFDIIQLEGPYPGLYLDLIRTKSSATVSLRAHNVEHLLWERKALQERSPLKKGYLLNMARRLKRFEHEVAQKADTLVPISHPDASYFMEQGIQKPSIIIPAGLNMGNYRQTELPEKPSIFFIGALDWLPNQEGLNWFLQNIFGLLLSELPGLEFHVAGRNSPGHFEKKLRHPNITYHGEVEDARRFIKSYRVMVAPLLSGSGIRVKILETLALGRPVATTSRGMEGIPVISHPFIVVEDDPKIFSARLLTLLKDPLEQKSLGADARDFIGRYFDTFELSKRLSQFYNTGE